jgi:hypothetical protein
VPRWRCELLVLKARSCTRGMISLVCWVRPIPVGSAMPNTMDKSTFPGIGLTCHFIAGDTSENPELPRPRTVAKYVGISICSSRQGAIPKRHRVFVPSTIRPPSRALKFTPFSLWRLPTGTTRLELVTSGRSVAISSFAVGQASACASTAPKIASAGSKHVWRVRLGIGWL